MVPSLFNGLNVSFWRTTLIAGAYGTLCESFYNSCEGTYLEMYKLKNRSLGFNKNRTNEEIPLPPRTQPLHVPGVLESSHLLLVFLH